MDLYLSFGGIVGAAVFLLLGLVVFSLVFRYFARVAVDSFREEIIEKQNVALALLVGLVSLAAGIIIAAAVH